MYCAVARRTGFVRVSMQTARFRDIAQRAQFDVLAAGGLAALGAALLALLFARSVSRPIVELRDVARAIARGDLKRRPTLQAPGEVGDLAGAVHRMAEQLGHRMDTIQREEALLLAVIDALDEGIVAVDVQGQVMRLTASARKLLRIGEEPPFASHRLPPERVLRDALRLAMQGQTFEPVESLIQDRTLAIAARPLAGGGAVLAVRDLTPQRRLELIRRDFVANVSHELKTPLTVISGFAETLQDSTIPEPQRQDFLEKIASNSARMQRIVDDLLDLSRYETGVWTPRVSDVEIEPLVREIFSATAPQRSDGVVFFASIQPGSDRVRADPTALRQILSNLIENSARYTAQGRIEVRAEPDANGRGVWISVEDTGSGIPPEHLPRIFERFYRIDAGRSRAAGGTGLGLSIVRHLVEAHGGEVTATSVAGKGTTISVLLPAA
jgi:signal transduction histidine kinase